jgi:hypothetical protein
MRKRADDFKLYQIRNTCSMREMSFVHDYNFREDVLTIEEFNSVVQKYNSKTRFKTILYNCTIKDLEFKLIEKFGFKKVYEYMGNGGMMVSVLIKTI